MSALMSDVSNIFHDHPGDGSVSPSLADVASRNMADKWDALEQAGEAAAMLAGQAAPVDSGQKQRFLKAMRDMDDARRDIVANAISDIDAMMQPGLVALLATVRNGHEPSSAARILWCEFDMARNGVLSLAGVTHSEGPAVT